MMRTMVGALTHRGPDDNGVELRPVGSAVVGLCATRLAIRDLSPRGHQPMVGPSGCVLALNGEIYNAETLRRRLVGLHHTFQGGSDTEVALRAYEEWGSGCFVQLEGMFAIAVWDPGRHQLLLARDRLGIKPLYYAQPGPGEFRFASELRAIIPHLGRPPRVSAAGVMTYLATGAVAEPDTIIDGITMLPAGHFAVYDSNHLELCRYWSLEEAFEKTGSPKTTRALAHELRERLEAAVRDQLVSDAPLAVFLSGGMDSSALVGLVSRVASAPPSTASIVFDEQAYSERAHIDAVQSHFHTDHHEITLTGEDFLGEIPNALSAMDQPTADGVNTYVVSKLARQAGFTVVLSGLGGDELFGGYDHFRSIPVLQAARRAIPSQFTLAANALVHHRYGDADRGRKLVRWLNGDVDDALLLQRELFEPTVRGELFPAGHEPSPVLAGPRIEDRINAISYGEIQGYMRNVLLRDSDVMSMAHGLELRVPLLDERIIKFVAGIPGRHKLSFRHSKPLLCSAVSDLLPESILKRKKAGFVLPFAQWMGGPLRTEVEGKLLNGSYGGPVAEMLDPGGVERIWRSYCAGTSSWNRPWALYALKEWGQQCAARSRETENGLPARS